MVVLTIKLASGSLHYTYYNYYSVSISYYGTDDVMFLKYVKIILFKIIKHFFHFNNKLLLSITHISGSWR